MPVREQPNQQPVDQVTLPDNGLGHLLLDACNERRHRLDLFVQLFNLGFHSSSLQRPTDSAAQGGSIVANGLRPVFTTGELADQLGPE